MLLLRLNKAILDEVEVRACPPYTEADARYDAADEGSTQAAAADATATIPHLPLQHTALASPGRNDHELMLNGAMGFFGILSICVRANAAAFGTNDASAHSEEALQIATVLFVLPQLLVQHTVWCGSHMLIDIGSHEQLRALLEMELRGRCIVQKNSPKLAQSLKRRLLMRHGPQLDRNSEGIMIIDTMLFRMVYISARLIPVVDVNPTLPGRLLLLLPLAAVSLQRGAAAQSMLNEPPDLLLVCNILIGGSIHKTMETCVKLSRNGGMVCAVTMKAYANGNSADLIILIALHLDYPSMQQGDQLVPCSPATPHHLLLVIGTTSTLRHRFAVPNDDETGDSARHLYVEDFITGFSANWAWSSSTGAGQAPDVQYLRGDAICVSFKLRSFTAANVNEAEQQYEDTSPTRVFVHNTINLLHGFGSLAVHEPALTARIANIESYDDVEVFSSSVSVGSEKNEEKPVQKPLNPRRISLVDLSALGMIPTRDETTTTAAAEVKQWVELHNFEAVLDQSQHPTNKFRARRLSMLLSSAHPVLTAMSATLWLLIGASLLLAPTTTTANVCDWYSEGCNTADTSL